MYKLACIASTTVFSIASLGFNVSDFNYSSRIAEYYPNIESRSLMISKLPGSNLLFKKIKKSTNGKNEPHGNNRNQVSHDNKIKAIDDAILNAASRKLKNKLKTKKRKVLSTQGARVRGTEHTRVAKKK
jgi:hypothetical protein